MSPGARWVGAHLTEAGWIAVAFDEDGYASAAVHDDVGELWGRLEDAAETILVDVPIGLAAPRRCDRLAREVLGDGVPVVGPPVRAAVRKRRFAVAARVHERHTGTPLSERAFGHRAAVELLDDLLAEVPAASAVFRESRPELVFHAFDGEGPHHDPATAGGYAERLATLASVDPDAPGVVHDAAERVGGHDVRVADVIDAVALAYAAWPGAPGDRHRLPADPPTDGEGRPMALTYRASAPLVAE